MTDPEYCLHCCLEKRRPGGCAECGPDASGRAVEPFPLFLRPGSLLRGQYLVGRVLGHGGFGVTYLGVDVNLGFRVAVKEHLPRDLATRGTNGATVSVFGRDAADAFRYGLSRFLDEGRSLARLRGHPNIVGVLNFFEENGTGYLAMDYVDGMSLEALRRSRGGWLPEAEAVPMMIAALDGLRAVHEAGLLHRDIKPQNLYVTRDGHVKLLDFGAARQAVTERSRSLSAVWTPGFAPPEQCHSGGRQGPWTDVYAAGAALYVLLTGAEMPDSMARAIGAVALPPPGEVPGAPRVSVAVSAAVMRAMSVQATDRFQCVREFQEALAPRPGVPGDAPRPAPLPVPEPPPAQPAPPPAPPPSGTEPIPPRPERATWLVGGAVVAAVLAGSLWAVLRPESGPAEKAPPAPQTATPAPPNPAGIDWVAIPAGTFRMGSEGPDADADEKPVREVTVEAFRMAKTEVTVAQYRRCVDAGACAKPDVCVWGSPNWGVSGRDDHPINCVRWDQAVAFSEWAGGRLPSEAEWEYAARGGTTGDRYGDLDAIAWHSGNFGGGTRPVGGREPNAYGLHDMLGNVSEWCRDWYQDSYSGAPSDGSAWQSPGGSGRVVRGGSWGSVAAFVRAAFRSGFDPGNRLVYLGFRPSRSVP